MVQQIAMSRLMVKYMVRETVGNCFGIINLIAVVLTSMFQ